MKNIFIVEDSISTCEWIQGIVEQLYEPDTIDVAYDLQSAQHMLNNNRYDLAIFDLHLPDGNGVDLIPHYRKNAPEGQVVVATIYDDDINVFKALRAGADGYLLKTQGEQEFASKLKGIDNGEVPISPAIARRMLTFFSELRPLSSGGSDVDVLTQREKEILTLVGKGYSRKEIASLLSITVNTTSTYIKCVYQKLGINSKSEAAAEANRMGLINLNI